MHQMGSNFEDMIDVATQKVIFREGEQNRILGCSEFGGCDHTFRNMGNRCRSHEEGMNRYAERHCSSILPFHYFASSSGPEPNHKII